MCMMKVSEKTRTLPFIALMLHDLRKKIETQKTQKSC
jgi:hypothetical protein